MLPGTYDLDIQNSIHVLLSQLLRKLDSDGVIPQEIHDTMEACAKKRDEIIRDELKMSRKQGKKLLHQVLFGANLPTALSGNEFMQKFQKASIYLKWLACSLLPKVYEQVSAMEKKSNPEASTLFYLYAAVEDYVLDAWGQDLMRRRPKHVSLHFDGIRVGGLDPEVSAQVLCDEAASAILKTTGFTVTIVEKRQLFFKELCASPVERVEEQIDAELLKRGNCIPLAMARLLPAKKDQILKALTAANHKNAEAEQSGSRCYNFLLKEMSIWAAPRLGLDTQKPGNFLLHMEDKGTPHCVACRIRDNELVELWDGLRKTRLLLPELVQFSEDAVDSSAIVTFQLFENDREREPWMTKERSAAAVLLQLRAGAGEADEE